MHRGAMFQFFEWYRKPDGTLWSELAAEAGHLAEAGITALWLPPPYKGFGGKKDNGYGVYDLYDLGEFDQKGTVRTKYGTREQLLEAITAAQNAGMHVYADVVFNHRMGGDDTEEVEIEEIDWHHRNEVISDPYTIRAWSHYTFPGRGERYSPLRLHWYHFTAFGANADDPEPDERKIYKVVDKSFAGEILLEYGAHDYLMGASTDLSHPEVRDDLFHWGRWFHDLAGVNGLRLDAVKHMPATFIREWVEHVREHAGEKELFTVAEYWSGHLEELKEYLELTQRTIALFDVPLHFNFSTASKEGREFDLRTIFDNTLIADDPAMAVTFVDNHDSQPGQALESWVQDWFKPHAYALILLREAGYPCIFYGDYYGNDSRDHPLTSHRMLIDAFLEARRSHAWGECHDYFDQPDCIGWVWTGDDEHGPMAVLMSNAETASKRMAIPGGPHTLHDVTGHIDEPITTDEHGEAEFTCPPGQISVWCPRR